MSPIINLNCTTEFIFTILHVVYYGVDITTTIISSRGGLEVEQWSDNGNLGGSIPAVGTKYCNL